MTEATWTHDPSHYPEPLSPLSGDVWLAAMGRGIREAARERPESLELVAPAVGAYLGEVMRQAFRAEWWAEGDYIYD